MNAILRFAATNKNLAFGLARIAVRALYFEVKAYPKPGLVSFIDSGAHDDMSGETFYRSLFTLRRYFYEISLRAACGGTFEQLKSIAIRAEQQMLFITAGINTHRGAIFALGLLCASTARLLKTNKVYTSLELHLKLIADWQRYLDQHQTDLTSHGALVRRDNKVIDARQIAMQGYAIVFHLLPLFIAIFEETKSIDITCLYAYLNLLTQVDDTNVLYRKGRQGLHYAKQQAQELLAINCLYTRQQQAIKIHQIFSEEGISPGGVADLISVIFFIGQLFCEQLLCH